MYNREEYIEPKIDVTVFESEDIIRTSNGLLSLANPGDNILEYGLWFGGNK